MLIWTTWFTRKKAVLIILAMGAAIAALICLFAEKGPAESGTLPQLNNNEQRVEYLQSYGWEVSPEPLETLQFLLPETLDEPYRTYNALQLPQGFDLAACCGKQVARYTYSVTNYPGRPEGVQVNLYVCEGLPAAGDIFCAGAEGFQGPLAFPEK